MRRATQHGKWLQSSVVALIVGGLGFWLVAEMNKPLAAEDLKIDVAELRSTAAEGRLLAEQALSERLTSTYFQTQLSMLRDNSEMVTKSLDSARPQVGLEEKLSQARVLAESVTTSLGRLSPSFGNQQEISRTKAELETLFNQAMDLEKSLQP